MTLAEDDKEGSSQGGCCSGVLELGREIRLHAERKGEWECIAKEQRGGQWTETTKSKHQG